MSGRSQLGWSHYRRLMQVADPAGRIRLTTQAIDEDWTGEETAARVAGKGKPEDLRLYPLPVCTGRNQRT